MKAAVSAQRDRPGLSLLSCRAFKVTPCDLSWGQLALLKLRLPSLPVSISSDTIACCRERVAACHARVGHSMAGREYPYHAAKHSWHPESNAAFVYSYLWFSISGPRRCLAAPFLTQSCWIWSCGHGILSGLMIIWKNRRAFPNRVLTITLAVTRTSSDLHRLKDQWYGYSKFCVEGKKN